MKIFLYIIAGFVVYKAAKGELNVAGLEKTWNAILNMKLFDPRIERKGSPAVIVGRGSIGPGVGRGTRGSGFFNHTIPK